MADAYPEPLFLDATVISNFASTDGCGLLARTLATPVVAPAVRVEIERGREHGHEYLATAVAAIGDTLLSGRFRRRHRNYRVGSNSMQARLSHFGERLQQREPSQPTIWLHDGPQNSRTCQ